MALESIGSRPLDARGAHTEGPHSAVSELFFSDDGLRAGWGIVLYGLLVFGFSAALQLLLLHQGLVHRPAPGAHAVQPDLTPRGTGLMDGGGFAVLLATAAVLAWVERRPLRRYGMPARRAVPDLLAGMAWGLTLLSALVGLLLLTHHLVWEGRLLHGAAAWRYGARWALAFLCVGLLEEFSLRGYLQYTLARGLAGLMRAVHPHTRHPYAAGFWAAALLLSVGVFAGAHLSNGGETVVGLLVVGLAGMVFAFSLWRTASLWWGIGFHAAWDWAQTFLYGTPDSGLHGVGHLFGSHPAGAAVWSGGTDGPEGSLLAVPVLLAALAAIAWTLPYRPRYRTANQTPEADAES